MNNYALVRNKYIELRRLYNVQIFTKDRKWNTLWVLIHYLLLFISLGKINNFNTKYVTTIGPYIFFPYYWRMDLSVQKDYVRLCHEAEHVRLYKKLGLGSIPLGFLIFSIAYIFLPLPIGFAWFRYVLERKAYIVSYKTWKSLGKTVSIEPYVNTLTGSQYFWAWPFKKSVTKWFSKNCN